MLRRCATLFAGALLVAACGDTGPIEDEATDEPSGPSVSFASPGDGDEVANPVAIELTASDFSSSPPARSTRGPATSTSWSTPPASSPAR